MENKKIKLDTTSQIELLTWEVYRLEGILPKNLINTFGKYRKDLLLRDFLLHSPSEIIKYRGVGIVTLLESIRALIDMGFDAQKYPFLDMKDVEQVVKTANPVKIDNQVYRLWKRKLKL